MSGTVEANSAPETTSGATFAHALGLTATGGLTRIRKADLPAGPAGATGATGATGGAGAAGADGRTLLNGSGAPASGIGANGDFYLNTADTTLWGPKVGGAWPASGVSLIGPPGSGGSGGGNTILNGTTAPAGGLGAVGDFYLRTSDSTLYGPKSSGGWGSPVSLIGAAGATGAKGDTGSQGIQGAKGDTGTTGAAGSDGKTLRSGSGAPAAGLGADGDFYVNTAASTIYGPKTAGAWGSPTSLIGPTGAKGDTGAQGPAFSATYADKGTTSAAATVTFDLSAAYWQRVQNGGAFTVALSNAPAAGTPWGLKIELVNGGAATITWPAGIKWRKADGTFTTTFADNGVTLQSAGTNFVLLFGRAGTSEIWGIVT